MTALNNDLATLLALIACPACRSALKVTPDGMRCVGCERRFEMEGRVPVLVWDRILARPPSPLARIPYAVLGNPRVYDFHQRLGGGRPIAARVQAALRDDDHSTLLDIGAGTGMVAEIAPAGMRYVWFDNDRLKLGGFVEKSIGTLAVLGDAARLPFVDRAASMTVMVEVSHHLPDEALQACLAEVARVTRDHFLFVDALRGPRLRSRLLWKLDLGRFPRTEEELVGALERHFEIETTDRFRVNHDHLLCVCRPRDRAAR